MDEENVVWALVSISDRKPFWTEDGGDRWINAMGGWCPKDKSDKILETATGVYYEDLDHKKTYLAMPDADENAGWLARDGTWHPCDCQAHNEYAELILKLDSRNMLEDGWVRVYYGPENAGKYDTAFVFLGDGTMSAEQTEWLRKRGHDVESSRPFEPFDKADRAHSKREIDKQIEKARKKGKRIRRKVDGD